MHGSSATALNHSTTFDRIIALDLGKLNSVACVYDVATQQHVFKTIATSPQTVHDLLTNWRIKNAKKGAPVTIPLDGESASQLLGYPAFPSKPCRSAITLVSSALNCSASATDILTIAGQKR